MPEIAVVIVNYQAAALAIEAVESVLRADAAGRSVEIHLVDNASPDGDGALLTAAFAERGWSGRVTLHLERENHGFGRGNNVVLKALARRDTPPDKVFLLNPDARLKNDALARLATFLDARPEVAVAGCRIEKPGVGPVTAAFRFPNIIGEFSAHLAFGPISGLLRAWEQPLAPLMPTGPVDWVSGAALMVRFRALVDVGFFDPAYFLYFEEVDLMRRLARAGWSTWHVAEAEVLHVEGAATGVRSGETVRKRRPGYVYESWRLYFAKNHGRGHALGCVAAAMTGAALNRLIATLRRRPPAAPLRYFGDVWRLVVWPLLTASPAARHG